MQHFMFKFKQLFWIVAVAISLFLSSFASAADWWVNGAATSNGSGTQGSPFNNLQSALNNPLLATQGDTIRVAQATYFPGTARGDSFVMSAKRANIQGGWVVGTPWTHSGNPDPSLTILSGNIGTGNLDSYTVMKLSNASMTDTNTQIEHLTITGAYGDSTTDITKRTGGGIRITAGGPRFHNVKITNNQTLEDGAGVYSNGASPVFTACTFQSNTVIVISFENWLCFGGGLYMTGNGNVRLINCSILSNSANWGGGIAAKSESNSTTLQMVNCLVASNAAVYSGGFSLTIEGGGIYVAGSDTAGAPVVKIVNCTVADNTSVQNTGGIKFTDAPGSHPGNEIHNSIVWGNTGSGAAEIWAKSGATLAANYCDVRNRNSTASTSGVSFGTGNIGENTTTHDPNFLGGGDYRLDCPTPCANAGDPNSTSGSSPLIPLNEFNLGNAGTGVTTPDLDLQTRVQNTLADMGAYEKTLPTCTGDFNGDGKVGTNDLLILINHWGPCPAAPDPCPWDLAPNGTVSTADLLALINAWGQCPCRTVAPDSIPEEVTDCMEICAEDEDFGGCVQKCLCAIQYITEGCD